MWNNVISFLMQDHLRIDLNILSFLNLYLFKFGCQISLNIFFLTIFMDDKTQTYLNNWQPEFRARTAKANTPPTQQRSCKDICCLVFFIIIFLCFIGLGIYVIASGWNNFNQSTIQAYIPNFAGNKMAIGGIVLGMAVFSLIISIIFVCLLKSCPKCMIYFSITLVMVAFVGLIIMAFVLGQIAMGIILIVLFILYIIIFCCCWKQNIDAAIIITRVTGKFLNENFSIYCVTILVAILNLVFLIFFVASVGFNFLQTYKISKDQTAFGVISLFQAIFYLFFTYYFYYLMVFVIAGTAALWYFKNKSSCCTAFCWSFYHIGTMTFASVLITIIKIIQMLARSTQRRSGNTCADICLCICQSIIQCCLACIEGLIKVLNHYAIILSALTAQDYMTSAKSAAVLIFSNFGLFTIVDSVSGFLFFTGILFSLIIPTIIGAALAYYTVVGFQAIIFTGVIVFLVSLIISIIFLSTLSESMTSIFVFYALEQKLVAYGQTSPYPTNTVIREQLVDGNIDPNADPKALLRAAVPLITPEYVETLKQQPFEPISNQNPNTNQGNQGNPSYNPQGNPNYNPQGNPNYNPQGNPTYNQQGNPYYNPQGNPYSPQRNTQPGNINTSQRNPNYQGNNVYNQPQAYNPNQSRNYNPNNQNNY